MRKVLFWLMLLIVLFLVIVIGVAAQKKTSPKAVLQDWFGSSTTGTSIEDLTGNYIPTETQSGTYADITGSGDLSDQDKQDTETFIDSLIQ